MATLPVVGNPAAPLWPGDADAEVVEGELPQSAWADDLFGRWTVEADHTDVRLGALAERLGSTESAGALRGVLADPNARVLIAKAVDTSGRQARLVRLDETLAAWRAAHFEHRGDTLAARAGSAEYLDQLKACAAQVAAELESLTGPLRTLRTNLRGDSAATEELRAFLGRDDALAAVYGLLIQPRLRPDPVRAFVSERFIADDAGGLAIPRAMRAQLQQELSAGRAQGERLAALVARTREIARRIPDQHEHLRTALGEPFFVALLAQDLRRRRPELSPGQVDAALADELGDSVARLAAGNVAAAEVEELLAAYRRAQRLSGRLRASAQRCAALIEPVDALHAGWRAYLPTEAGLLAAAAAAPVAQADAATLLSTATPLGLNITREGDGSYRVIAHGEADLERTLAALRATAASQAAFAARLAAHAAALADANLRELLTRTAGVCCMAEELRAELVAVAIDDFATWQAAWFVTRGDEVTPRAGASAELERLAGQAEARRQAAVQPPEVVLDLRAVQFAAAPVGLLRSSSFYAKRTALGERIYLNEFDDHETIRPFLSFEWPAQQSRDVASFAAELGRNQAEYARLAETHRRFVIVIAKTPDWLSRSSDRTAFEALWTNANAHPPRDWDAWGELVRATVRFFQQFPVERYYEIWNEPDSRYWQGTEAEYLELYARTAAAIREVDPAARIGGSAVNRWQGTAAGAADLEPLNFGLVRLAAREGVPLDFVSWHQYSGDPANIPRAAEALRGVLREAGVRQEPQFYLSEWGNAARDTEYSAALLAEHFAAMIEAGVDLQTAVWEDMEAKADPKAYAPYGLITQQGRRKPEYFAYRFADRLSRNANAVGVFRASDGQTRALVGRGADGVYDVLLWRIAYSAPMTAALRALNAAGLSDADVRAYGSAKALERALLARQPRQRGQKDAFAAARQAYLAQAEHPQVLELVVGGAETVTPLGARAVRAEHSAKQVFADGRRLVFELEPYELVWLRLQVR